MKTGRTKRIFALLLVTILILTGNQSIVLGEEPGGQAAGTFAQDFNSGTEGISFNDSDFSVIQRPDDRSTVYTPYTPDGSQDGALLSQKVKGGKAIAALASAKTGQMTFTGDFRLEAPVGTAAGAVQFFDFYTESGSSFLKFGCTNAIGENGYRLRAAYMSNGAWAGTAVAFQPGGVDVTYKTWHTLRVELDSANKTMSLWVDNVQLLAGVTVSLTNDASVNLKSFQSYHNADITETTGQFMIDNLLLTSHEPVAPVAENVVVDGITMVGSSLSVQADIRDVNGDLLDTPLYQWQRSDSPEGSWTNIEEAEGPVYLLTEEDTGQYIRAGVTPVSTVEPKEGTQAFSQAAGPILPVTAPPSITGMVTILGTAEVGNPLTAGYTYQASDAGLTEGATTFLWERASAADGDYSPIADTSAYTSVFADKDKYIRVTVTPVDSVGLAGEPRTSAPIKITSEAEGPAPIYKEDFENGLGKFEVRFGTPEISDAETHSGSYAVHVGSNMSAQGVWYRHDILMEDWSLSAWMYDDMSNSASVIHCQETDTSTRGVNFFIGYNMITTNDTNYATRFGDSTMPTAVERTPGWHHIQVVNDYSSTMELKIYIDGVHVKTYAAFKMRTVTMGNFWSDKNTSTTRYWDDFELYDLALDLGYEEEQEEVPARIPAVGKDTLAYQPAIDIPGINSSIMLMLNSPDAYVNNIHGMIDREDPLVMPVKQDNTILVPVEIFAENFGAELAWADDARTLTLEGNNKTAEIVLNTDTMTVDGDRVELKASMRIIDGRIYVPLRDIAGTVFNKQVTEYDNGLIAIDDTAINLSEEEVDTLAAYFNRPALTFFVAAEGDDHNPGTIELPFKSLEAAREKIRTIKAADGLPDGGITVYIRGGEYPRSEPFVLEEQDSGTRQAPIRYCGYFGEEIKIHNGHILYGSDFTPVSDQSILDRLSADTRHNVLVADLGAMGITRDQLGDITYQGHGVPLKPSESELIIDNQVMIRARYPNQGDLKIRDVIREGSIPRAGDTANITPVFEYKDTKNRAKTWGSLEDVWIYGFPKNPAYDNTIAVKTIDAETNVMELIQPSYYGVSVGQGFYFFNILEELDMPGEWYLDKENLKMYLYPSGDINHAEIALTLGGTGIIDLKEVSYLTIENLNLGYTRQNAINIWGGSDVNILGNTIHNTGEKAIMAGNYPVADEYDVNSTNRGGLNYTIKSNDIYNIGKGAILISGGNRDTLEYGNMLLENNHIWNYSRLRMEDAIKIFGVGNRVAHNKIHDAPKKAIQFGGNDIIVEYNEIYDVCYSVDDMGAVYMGRDLTYQGNEVRHNFFHNITGLAQTGVGVHAVYFDDFSSNGKIYGNMMYKVHNPIKFNGGSNHQTYNNIIYMGIPNSNWYADTNNFSHNANFDSPTHQVGINYRRTPYESQIWTEKYPHLAAFINGKPSVPRNNIFEKNVISKHKPIGRYYPDYGNIVRDTFETQQDIGFVDEANLNFNLREDSIVYTEIPDFQPLEFDKMGLYMDLYRTLESTRVIIEPTIPEEPEEPQEPQEPQNPQQQVPPTLEDKVRQAFMDAVEKAGQSTDGSTRILLEMEKVSGADEYVKAIPADALSEENVGRRQIEIKSPLATLMLPDTILKKELVKNAGIVEIRVSKVNAESLNPEFRNKIADRPVVELKILVDGKEIQWKNSKAPITVGIQYAPTEEELKRPDHIVGWYLDAEGNAAKVPTANYSSETEAVSFTITSLGKVAVAFEIKTFTDIGSYWWAQKEIEALASRGVIAGTSDATFSPQKRITRADFLVLMVRALGLTAEFNDNFVDVTEKDYFHEAVGIARVLGITTGTGNNKFDPDAAITRQDMMVIAARCMKAAGKELPEGSLSGVEQFEDAGAVAGYAKESIAALIDSGIIAGDGRRINPSGKALRAEAAVMIYKIYIK